jgi:hypothetical protein
MLVSKINYMAWAVFLTVAKNFLRFPFLLSSLFSTGFYQLLACAALLAAAVQLFLFCHFVYIE